MRTLDKQGDFTGFISDTSKGFAGMVAGNAFYDLLANYNGDLASFPAYLDLLLKLVKALSPILTADAICTQNTFGEDYSLY